MDKIRYRFWVNDKNLLWRRFKAILTDWSDEIENPGVKWCLKDTRLHDICDKLEVEFNGIVYDEDNTGYADSEILK